MGQGLALARAPFTLILDGFDHELGTIPGPLALDASGGALWAVGGDGEWKSAVYRYAEGRWTKCARPRSKSITCVLALDERTAIVGGEKYLGRTEDGGARFERLGLKLSADEVVYALAREASGTLWAGGSGGLLARSSDGGATFERLTGIWKQTARHIVPAPWGGVYVVCEDRALGGSVQWFVPGTEPEMLSNNDIVSNLALGDRRIVAVGRDGGVATAAPGERLEWLEAFTTADLRAVRAVEGGFVALDARGGLHTSADGRTWESATVAVERPSSLVEYAGGWVIGGAERSAGMLAYLGDPANAPRVAPIHPGLSRPVRHQ